MSKQNHWISSYGCVYNIFYHLVWSTKYRRKYLIGNIETRLKELHLQIAEDKGFEIITQEIQPDHVHLFVRAHPKYDPSTLTKWLKGITARKILLENPDLRNILHQNHLWNPSYYVGTCGDCSKDVVLKYIEMQKEK